MVDSVGAHAGVERTSSGKGAVFKGGGSKRAGFSGLLVAAALALPVAAAEPPERSTPSGLPVPRYVTLKFDEVNARAGPGDDHRLLWIYRVRGLPVQVVAETAEWRRICDPDHGLAWVHRRTTDGRRMVMQAQSAVLPLRAGPKPDSRVRAYMAPRSLGSLDHCKGGWCRIKVDRIEGWAPASALWGTAEPPQCP